MNELTKDAMNTYLLNRLDRYPWLSENKEHDVKELVRNPVIMERALSQLSKEHSVTDIDLLVGGPPCQGYSGIGHRRSYSVDKKQLPSNYLYEDMAFLINLVRPKMFMFENVRGLLNARWTSGGQKGEIWQDVCETLSAIPGYNFETALVFAKDYGVPQNRPRVLGVGIRNDVYRPASGTVANGYLPEATGGYPSIEDLFADLVDEDYRNGPTVRYPSAARTAVQKLLRQDPVTGKVRAKNSVLTEQEYSKHSDKIIAKFEHMIEFGGEIPHNMKTKKFAQRVLPKVWGKDGPNITATSLPDDYVHYLQPRSLTVREWARLQMFPDWYRFSGKRTTGGLRRAGNPREGVFDREAPKYTQIGNAVPVRLAEAAGRHFIDVINTRTKAKGQREEST